MTTTLSRGNDTRRSVTTIGVSPKARLSRVELDDEGRIFVVTCGGKLAGRFSDIRNAVVRFEEVSS